MTSICSLIYENIRDVTCEAGEFEKAYHLRFLLEMFIQLFAMKSSMISLVHSTSKQLDAS